VFVWGLVACDLLLGRSVSPPDAKHVIRVTEYIFLSFAGLCPIVEVLSSKTLRGSILLGLREATSNYQRISPPHSDTD
jgi:hypothetical protein